MKIILNGQPKTIEGITNITDLLQAEKQDGMKIAVAKNGTFVPKAAYGQTLIHDGDQIEIVAPMQGG
ncbi:MAG: sulfur carrier protein ThiS [Bdellovibrionales bacterium]